MIDINCPITHTPKLTAGAALVVAHAIGRMLLDCDAHAAVSEADFVTAKAWVEAHARNAAGTTVGVAAELLAKVASELAGALIEGVE